MKNSLSFLWSAMLFTASLCAAPELFSENNVHAQKEAYAFIEQNDHFTNLDPELIALVHYFINIKDQTARRASLFYSALLLYCNTKNNSPFNLIKAALEEIFDYLTTAETPIQEGEKEQFLTALEDYYNALESEPSDDTPVAETDDALATKNIRFKRYRTLQTRDLLTNYLTSRSATLNGTILVNNNESVADGLIVSGTLHAAADSDFFQAIDVTG